MSLEQISRFRVPAELVDKTERELRRAGRDGYELFVLWSGAIRGPTFTVQTMHVPAQTSYKTKAGLLIRVEGEELHRLNVWLYEHNQTLAVQVHAHPTEAFHSTTDDAYPIVTELGGLSLVAADFARGGVLNKHSKGYRLGAHGWRQVRNDRLADLIRVTP